MSATKFPGWLSLPEAALKYRTRYETLRRLVAARVFTRGVFGAAPTRPPVYLRTVELDAWKSGGVAAVAPLKTAFEASSRELAATSEAGA